MDVTVYGLDISHPTQTALLMLGHKEIPHSYSAMPPGSQPLVLRARGFRGATVPAMRIDDRRVQGSLAISREIERVRPEPPLFPVDPTLRAAVEEAERWGDATYQPIPRVIFRWALTRDRALRTFLAGSIGLPAARITGEAFLPPAIYFARSTGATDERIERALRELPSHLDHVDELLADGTIGGATLNAADFQIATTTRVLGRLTPIASIVEGRPAAEHALRVCPEFEGDETSIEIPAGWLPSVSATQKGEVI